MFNRLPLDEFATIGDRALAKASRLKLDLWRIEADEDEPAETRIEYEVSGTLDAADDDTAGLIAGMLAALGGKGGDA